MEGALKQFRWWHVQAEWFETQVVGVPNPVVAATALCVQSATVIFLLWYYEQNQLVMNRWYVLFLGILYYERKQVVTN
jgi:hypothetical protein